MGSELSGIRKLTTLFTSLLYIAQKPFLFLCSTSSLFYKLFLLTTTHLGKWISYFLSMIMVFPYTIFATFSIIISYFLAIFFIPQDLSHFPGKLQKKVDGQLDKTDERVLVFSSCVRIHADWAYLICCLNFELIGYFCKLDKRLEFIIWAILVPYIHFKKRLKEPPDFFFFHVRCMVICISCILFMSAIQIYRVTCFKLGILKIPVPKCKEPSKQLSKPTENNLQESDKIQFVFTSSTISNAPKLFDSNSSTCIVDNSANTHCWNNSSHFVGKIRPLSSSAITVSTIGGSNHSPKGIGDIRINWTDDNNYRCEYLVKNVLYFPSSPVNVLSVTQLARCTFNDDSEGTFITTKMNESYFTWDNNKYTKTIIHPDNNLPQMAINDGFYNYTSFCKFCNSFFSSKKSLKSCSFNSDLGPDSSILSNISPSTNIGQQYDDISDDEILLDGKRIEERAEVGSKVRYVSDNMNLVGEILSIETDPEGVITYKLLFPNGDTRTTTHEFILLNNDTSFTNFPQNKEAIREKALGLPDEVIDQIKQSSKISPLAKEFLSWHERLMHIPFSEMFELCKRSILPKKFLPLKNNPPLCVSCQFGCAHKRHWRFKGKCSGSIRKPSHNQPGSCVSVDQIISAQPGFIPQMSGKLLRDRIWAVTLFIDHCTDFLFSYLQTSTSQEETIKAKHSFEKQAAISNICIKKYHADNGRFAEKGFKDEVEKCNQTISYCGVGAHHQNGLIETTIKSVTNGARTILLHAQRHWPEAIMTMLWPFAVQTYVNRRNELKIGKDGKTPNQRWTQCNHPPDPSKFHTWGCPIFVLDSRLQSSLSAIPKWEPRSRIGIYVGHSPCHAGNVALVLNPATGHVSPQFHVVFDDDFTTVPYMRNGTIPPHWASLVKESSQLSTDEDFSIAETWFEKANQEIDKMENQDNAEEPTISEEKLQPTMSAAASGGGVNVGSEDNGGDPRATETFKEDLRMPEFTNLYKSGLRRSKRIAENEKVKYTFLSLMSATSFFSKSTNAMTKLTSTGQHLIESTSKLFDNTINYLHSFSTVSDSNDIFTFKEMLQQPDRNEFVKAMLKEVSVHEQRNHWTMVPRSAVPTKAEIVIAIWSFKRKRHPNGSLNKHKARLCAHGGMQHWGVSYWETYAPVVNWMSVRILLILSIIFNLKSRSIDFVLAFPQADLDTPVYMCLPVGMESETGGHKVLRLNKALYGLKQAAHNWFQKLDKAMQIRNFIPSMIDPCVYLKKGIIVLVYVDDVIILSPRDAIITNFIKSLQGTTEGFELTDKGSLEKYLGVNIKKHKDGILEMSQPYLIERIIKGVASNPSEWNPKTTPVGKPLLHKDLTGVNRKCKWHYRSIIGMLNYLAISTRPELSMAVHQAARFCQDPKLSHERAVQHIIRYLIGTKDKGLLFKPNKEKGLECYVDADFAGGWANANASDADSILSRTGFVILYHNCPIFWSSKLQTEITLSTAEAEYIALSQAMRSVVPLITFLEELSTVINIEKQKPVFKYTVFEDNRSCIAMTQQEKFSP